MSENKWVVLLGAPGCGKGTQAEYLINQYGFKTVSVGELLRSNRETIVPELGKTIGEVISSGTLLPDGIVLDLVRKELKSIGDLKGVNLIYDGFPRTVGQAEEMDEVAAEFGTKIGYVLNFVVDDEVITKRILGRYKCSNCGKIYNDFFLKPEVDGVCDVCGSKEFDRRADDNEESLKKRLSEYHSKTSALIEYYTNSGALRNIKADADFEEVRHSVLESLNLIEGEE